MWAFVTSLWLVGAHAQTESDDLQPEISAELCVRAFRERRDLDDVPELVQGFAVPETVAHVRNRVGIGRLPDADATAADFLAWMPEALPEPGEELAVQVETATHPLDPNRALVRVSYRAPAAGVVAEPVFLVALVNVSSSMRSVGTRTLPVMMDQREPDSGNGLYRPVTRIELVQESLKMLAGQLPEGSMVAVAAFDRGAKVVMPPTLVDSERRIREQLAGLRTDEFQGGQGIDVVAALVEQVRSYCGDTHVMVISDGPLGFGAPQDETLELVKQLSSEGVTFSVLLPMTRMRRSPALEQLAWLGHGRHHYAESMADIASVWDDEFHPSSWTARDISIAFNPDPSKGWTVRRIGGTGLEVRHDGLPPLKGGEALFEVTRTEGASFGTLGQVQVQAGSAIPGEWTVSETLPVPAPKVGVAGASKGLRRAFVATALAEAIGGQGGPSLETLLELARSSVADEPRSDLELSGLIERYRRLLDESSR